MPFNDGIDRKFCFSLTDFHDFGRCSFRFFVFHHLNKKYELSEGNENMALGSLLDQTIKLFHSSKSYGQHPGYLSNLTQAACNLMKEKVAKQSSPSFYSAIIPFLTPELVQKASEIFKNYYIALDRKIKKSLGEVGFCEWVIKDKFKLWGGPDALELGEDGLPEVVDYKYREDRENGKDNLDMDLMPKIYVLLCTKKLLDLGFKKARFVVRFWLDPKDSSFSEVFDLEKIHQFEEIFKQKIEKILKTSEVNFCEKSFCRACQSPKRKDFLRELEGLFTNS